jgi:hypothetical protein
MESLSDYFNYFKKMANESLIKQNYNNNCNEIAQAHNSINNNEDLKGLEDLNINCQNTNGNQNNKILCSSPTKIKTDFTSQDCQIVPIKKDENEFNPFELLLLLIPFFTLPKYGRIPNKLKTIKKGKHDKTAKDNSRSKLFTSCAKSLDDFIRNEFKKYNKTLHCLNIKSQVGENLYENEKFFDKKIIDIYFDSTPKRYNDNNKDFNKKQIKSVLEKEMQNNNIKIKLLNILFNMKLKRIFKMYIYDIPYFIISINNNDYKIDLIGFKTFKYDLEEEDDETKEQYKKNAKDFINGKISHRKLRKKHYEISVCLDD